jgi:tetratricopeptide (TPR) repeat protein
MKQFNNYVYLGTLIVAFLFTSINANAQLDLPRGSQNATVSQTVGTTKMYVNYSRPSVNDREIWGKLVPYGMNNFGFGTATESPWRAGANENTFVKFTDDVTVEGKALPAGKYGLHVVVKEDGGATIIFSNNSTAWGSFFYEPSEDALQVDVQTTAVAHTEQLTFSFVDVSANSATIALDWEKKRIPFKVETNVTENVLADIRKELQNQPGFNRQTWEQAAGFAMNNGGDMDEALGWINAAIAGQFFSQQTFNNTNIKAGILAKMGKQEEAVSAIESYMPQANLLEMHQIGRTFIQFGMKDKALDVFKANAEKNANTWPVDYGLARGYSAVGDYAKALVHLKIAHSRVPDAGNKAAIEANLAKLEKGEDIN